MQTKALQEQRVKTAILLATVIAFAIFSASCGGGGVAAVPTLDDPPAVNLSPVGLSFGSQPLDRSSSGQTVTLTNTGNATLSIASSAVTGPNASDFAQTNNCGTSVAAGASCTISVTFTPTATGTRGGTLSISDNAPGSPHTVTLSGTGAGSRPAVSLAPAGLTFSLQTVGTTSGAQAVTLTNTGNATLSVTSLAVSGTNASDFAQTNNCGASVAAGTNCTISVTFTPAASGSRTATVTLTDNATGSPQTVSLSGTGGSTGAVANLSPSSLTYGNEPVDVISSSQVVTLNNTGSAALSITSIAFTGANATDFIQVDTCGASVAAGGNCTIAIMFTPSAIGTRVASLSITDNAIGSPQPVSLSGTGTQPGPTGLVYYVDNCVVIGSDSNNGSSTATPWLTVNKVNTSTFNPGDSILFESTCTWREQLTVRSSGSAGSPITFGVYGTGAQPIISGADLLTSWVSELPLYYASVAAQPNQVFLDNQRLTLAASKAALATGQWWWDSTNSRVYIYDDPSGQTIEDSQRTYAVYGCLISYVTISGLELAEANSRGLYCNGCTGLYVTGVSSLYSYDEAFRVDISPNTTYTQSTAAYSGQSGFGAWRSSSLLVDRVVTHDNCQLTVANYTGGMYIGGVSGGTAPIIQYSTSYNNGLAVSGTGSRGAGIWLDTVDSGAVVQYNLVYSNWHSNIEIDADNNSTVIGNVVYGGGNGATSQFGIVVFADANNTLTGHQIYGNTVYGVYYAGLEIQGNSGGYANGCTNNNIENNIVVGTIGGRNLFARYGCENAEGYGSGNVYTYNDFGTASSNFIEWGNGSNYSTYATWETATGNCGTSGCSHSVQADPQFVNAAAAQFWLASSSPAIDAGTNVGSPHNIGLLPASSWPNSVLTGDQNSYGTGWEVGAYIFTGQTVQ